MVAVNGRNLAAIGNMWYRMIGLGLLGDSENIQQKGPSEDRDL